MFTKSVNDGAKEADNNAVNGVEYLGIRKNSDKFLTQQSWVVWGVEDGMPSVFHTTYESAVEEAKRLAVINTNSKFVVLQVVASVFVPKVVKVNEFKDKKSSTPT